jgi:hypothetical protein
MERTPSLVLDNLREVARSNKREFRIQEESLRS